MQKNPTLKREESSENGTPKIKIIDTERVTQNIERKQTNVEEMKSEDELSLPSPKEMKK